MCRFVLVKAHTARAPLPILKLFARMAEHSRSLDGDWQGDGWGVSWYDDCAGWQSYTSLAPVWRDASAFAHIPACRVFAAHARSASFPSDVGDIASNQPFLVGQTAFVFNGLLQGMRLPMAKQAGVGAQKIAALLRPMLAREPAPHALQRLTGLLTAHSRRVAALNLGLSDGRDVAVFSQFDTAPEYYQLRVCRQDNYSLVASEPLDGHAFSPLEPGVVHVL